MRNSKQTAEGKKSVIFTEAYDLRKQAIELAKRFKDIIIDKKLLK